MITRDDYFQGRDKQFPGEWTVEVESNAQEVVRRVNALLEVFGQSRAVNSGWRPAAINGATPGAAQFSRHMTAQACDLRDPHGDLDEWCLDHIDILETLGLYLEHPSATKGWCHVQTVPPRSGKRVFYP